MGEVLICAVSFGAGARVGSLLTDEHVYAFSLGSAKARAAARGPDVALLLPGLAPLAVAVAALAPLVRVAPLVLGLREEERAAAMAAGAYVCLDLRAADLRAQLVEVIAVARWAALAELPRPAARRR